MSKKIAEQVFKRIQLYPKGKGVKGIDPLKDYEFAKQKGITLDLITFEKGVKLWCDVYNKPNIYTEEIHIQETLNSAFTTIQSIRKDILKAIADSNLSRIENYSGLLTKQVDYFVNQFSEEYMRYNADKCTIIVPDCWIFNFDFNDLSNAKPSEYFNI